MPPTTRERFYRFLRSTERYTKTDMVYLASGGFWLILGQVGSIVLALSTAIAFGHLATQDTYGNYRYVLSLAGLFGAFSLTGIGTAIAQATARGFDGSLRQGFSLAVKWSWGIVLLSLGAAAYYGLVEHNAFVGLSLVIVAAATPILNGFSLFDPFLVGKKQFARDTTYNFLNALFPVAAVIIALFLTHRAIIIVIVYFAANALSDVLFYVLSLRESVNDTTDPGLLSYGRHLSVIGIINAVADRIDSITIFTLLGPAQLAIYAYAIAMPDQIKQMMKNILPLSMSKFAVRSIQEIQAGIWPKMMYLAAGLTVTLAAYILCAPFLFHLLFPVYASAIVYSQIYALTLVLAFIPTPIGAVFQAHKKVREQYITTSACSIVLLIVLPILTYYFGIMGAIVSQFFYRFFNVGIALFYFMRLTDDPS